MSSCRAAERCFGGLFRWCAERRFSPVSIAVLVVAAFALAGCGAKTITSKPPFVVQQDVERGYPSTSSSASSLDQKRGTVYLPSDDGRPLSRAEEEAFLSEGELDRNLSQEDMVDVLLHFKYLVHQDRYTVEKNIQRAELYMPFIFETLRLKRMPRELAYIAFIESGYNPKATSRSGAAGMWQFIPSTGKYYGMEQDWWIDERRDPYQSTRAAADYLAKLYGMFNDWHLAITAYNAGEGKIQRGLAATGAKTFFELRRKNEQIYSTRDRLSDENKQYLPKFIAVCKIARNLDKLGFSSMDLSRAPQIAEVKAKPGTDLVLFSKTMGISWDTFVAHNPAYQRNVSPPSRSTTIYVPRHMASHAQAMLFKLPPAGSSQYAGLREYKIVRGDTMASVSRKTGVPVAELRRVNHVSEPLRPGKTLKIPGSTKNRGREDIRVASASSMDRAVPRSAGNRSRTTDRLPSPASSQAAQSHIVRQGDTMYSIAKRYGVSQEAIIAANGMKGHQLGLGQQLRIPSGDSAAVASSGRKAPAASASNSPVERTRTVSSSRQAAGPDSKGRNKVVQYTVQSGDTLWAIARKFNVSPMDLLSLNNMDKNTSLRPGDTVRVAVN